MNNDAYELIQEKLAPYINSPVAIRHNYSGVWIGILKGPSFLPHMITIEGRRIWSWSGGRLEFSHLCANPVRAEDRLGVWTEQHLAIGPGDGLVELTFQVSQEVVESVRNHENS